MNVNHLNISIVGLGVIGGSFAYHLNKLNFNNIWGIDKNLDTLQKAEADNMIEKGFDNPQYPIAHSDIVILCIYPGNIVNFIQEYMYHFKSGAIIMDASGIKSKIMDQINIERDDIDFVGGHPMAGNEGIGITSASKTLFNNANFIITPTENNKAESISLLTEILKEMGFGKISQVTPQMHDEMIGYTSQLPHIIAASIINCHDNEDILRFTGNSFGEFTRIAKMNAPLWTDLIIGNKDNILHLIDAFIGEMDQVRTAIAQENKSMLEEIFSNCTRKKEEMK